MLVATVLMIKPNRAVQEGTQIRPRSSPHYRRTRQHLSAPGRSKPVVAPDKAVILTRSIDRNIDRLPVIASSFYLDHRDEVDQYVARSELELAEERECGKHLALSDLRARLESLHEVPAGT